MDPRIGQIEPMNLRSMTLSVGVHGLLLLCLVLFWNQSRRVGSGEDLRRVAIVLASPTDETEYFDEADQLQEPEANKPDQPSETSALPTSEAPPVELSLPSGQVAATDLPLPGLDASAMTNVPKSSNSPRELNLTDRERRMLDAERAAIAARQPKGPPTTIQVFGSGDLTGRKFVFVIDRSKSMGGQGLNVLRSAARELSSSISNLQDNHEFQVVAYHHDTIAIARRELLPATEANKSLISDFVHALGAYGGTEHEGALMVALGMDPDVIVLITDGGLPELNEGQMLRIRRAAGGTQIHCIQFGSGPLQADNPFMQLLAMQNDGTFRYIDVNRWNRNQK